MSMDTLDIFTELLYPPGTTMSLDTSCTVTWMYPASVNLQEL
jgi:hypothetical protein